MLSDRVRTTLDKIISDAEAGGKAPHRALTRPRMRPYLPDRRALRTIGAGLGVITRAAWSAVRTGTGRAVGPAQKPTKTETADTLEKLGTALLIGVVAVAVFGGAAASIGPLISPFVPWIIGIGIVTLLVAALIAAPAQGAKQSAGPPRPAAAPAPEEPEASPPTPAEVVRAARKIAAMRDWSGVHLTDLEDHLGTTRENLLYALAEAEITVENQLKLMLPNGHQRNRQGVRLRDLPTLPGKAPPEGAEPPAQAPPQAPGDAPARPLPEPATATPHGSG